LLPLPLLGWLPGGDAGLQPAAATEANLHPAIALELDTSASKHLAQPFLPDLMNELVSHGREPEPSEQ